MPTQHVNFEEKKKVDSQKDFFSPLFFVNTSYFTRTFFFLIFETKKGV